MIFNFLTLIAGLSDKLTLVPVCIGQAANMHTHTHRTHTPHKHTHAHTHTVAHTHNTRTNAEFAR